MTITLKQTGQKLELTSNAPVQYSDNVPVTVTLDSEYSNADEIVLLTQMPFRGNPARTVLTRSGSTATGAIPRAMLLHAGQTQFVLAGKAGSAYIPTAECMVDVQRSVDPQAQTYAQAPTSVIDLITAATADYLQTDAGRQMLADKLTTLATEQGFIVPVLSDSVTSASSTVCASSAAVKKAYDRAGEHTAIHETHAVTVSTAMSYTGVTITIPAHSYFNITATAHYDHAKPTIVGFYEYHASDPVETCSAPVGNYNAVVALSGHSGENARDLHVFAAYADGGTTNDIVVEGFYITISE